MVSRGDLLVLHVRLNKSGGKSVVVIQGGVGRIDRLTKKGEDDASKDREGAEDQEEDGSVAVPAVVSNAALGGGGHRGSRTMGRILMMMKQAMLPRT